MTWDSFVLGCCYLGLGPLTLRILLNWPLYGTFDMWQAQSILTRLEEEAGEVLENRFQLTIQGFLGTFLGVPMLRIRVVWGLYWGPLT